jgi:hypothetical protein
MPSGKRYPPPSWTYSARRCPVLVFRPRWLQWPLSWVSMSRSNCPAGWVRCEQMHRL